MDTRDIVVVQILLDPMFATTAIVDTLLLVVLPIVTVGVEAIGVQLNLLVRRVSTNDCYIIIVITFVMIKSNTSHVKNYRK